jgi:hypothetical protein
MKQNRVPKNEYIIQPKGKTNPYKHDVDYKSKMGYRDDSPYNQNAYNDIHTSNGMIDMSQTGIPLFANGRYLPPYSGMHYLGSPIVREIPANQFPMARYGGGLPKAQDGLSATPTYYGGKEQNMSQYPMTTAQKLIHKSKTAAEAQRQYNTAKALSNVASFIPGPIGYTASGLSGGMDISEGNTLSGALQFVPTKASLALSGLNNLISAKDIYNYNVTPEPTYPDMLPYYTNEYKRELFKPQSITSQAYGGDPSLNNIEGHYPFGGQNTKTHTHMKGGGSLNRKVTCSNCGWSWKLVDGGTDPMTCHKCGGTIKMENGGWLDTYDEGGEKPWGEMTPKERAAYLDAKDALKEQHKKADIQANEDERKSREQAKKEYYKDWVAENYEQGAMNPLFQTVAGFTPFGAIPYAMQSAASAVNNLAQGNYLAAGIDAAFSTPLFKGLKGVKKIIPKAKQIISHPTGKMEGLGNVKDVNEINRMNQYGLKAHPDLFNKKYQTAKDAKQFKYYGPNNASGRYVGPTEGDKLSGFTDLPSFNEKLNKMMTTASFGKRLKGKDLKINPITPTTTRNALMEALDNSRYEEGMTDLIPTQYMKEAKIPYNTKKAFQNVQPNKYGGLIMQKGGRTPIVVDDKNDPRLRAYNDSLATYNLSNKAEKLFNKNSSDPQLQVYNQMADKVAKRTNIKPVTIKTNSSEFTAKGFDPMSMQEEWMAKFKKPVQPYIYKKPEEKEQSRTDVYTDKVAFDKAYKAEMDSLTMYKHSKKFTDLIKTGVNKANPQYPQYKNVQLDPNNPLFKKWRDSQNDVKVDKAQENLYKLNGKYPKGVYDTMVSFTDPVNKHYVLTYGSDVYKKPVVHNVYQPPPPPEEEPIKDTIPYSSKPKLINSDTIRQWNFNGPNPVMQYYDKSGKHLYQDYFKNMNDFAKGKKTESVKKQNGGWLDDEYRRGGQKIKKYTSKNIQSSVNDLFTRNETLFGPAGKKRYKPGLKYQDGGNLLNKYQDTGEVVPKDASYENKQFLINMANSPLFNERYSKMTGSDNLSEIETYKNNIINNINNVNYETNPKKLNRHNAEGMYMPENHTIYKTGTPDNSTDLHELSHASTKGKLGFKNPYTYDPSHFDDIYGNVKHKVNENDYNFLKNLENKKYSNKKIIKYLSDPSEIKSRIDVGRRTLKDNHLYDPINERFEEKHYEDLKRFIQEPNIEDLLHNYSKEDVIRMFNETVTNKPKTQPVAKMGGNWLDNLH